MTISCDKENPNCDLNVGDLVDWKHATTSPSRQTRFWHGQIVDLWNTDQPGHWFVVRWDISNKQGIYHDPRIDLNHDYFPYSPHYWQEQCRELRICGRVPRLHPSVNELLPHP